MEEAFPFPARVPFFFLLRGRTYPSPPPTPPSLNSATGSGQRTRPTMPVSAHASGPLTGPCRGESLLCASDGTGRGCLRLRARGSADHETTRSITNTSLPAAAIAKPQPPFFFRRPAPIHIRRSPVAAILHLDPAAAALAARSFHTFPLFFPPFSASSLARPVQLRPCLPPPASDSQWPC